MKRSGDVAHLNQVLEAIARDVPVQEWNWKGIPVWPILRIQLNLDATYAQIGASTLKRQGKKRREAFKVLHSLKKLLQRLTEIHRRANVPFTPGTYLFCTDEGSFISLGHTLCHKHADPLIHALQALGKNAVRWDFQYTSPGRSLYPGVYIGALLNMTLIKAELLNAVTSTSKLKLKGYSDFKKKLEQEGFGNIVPSVSWIQRRLIRHRALKGWFKRHTRSYAQKVAFVVSYYSEFQLAFTAACQEAGVKVVDLQHGVQGSLHAAYSGWQEHDLRHSMIPRIFWVWRLQEQKMIRRWTQNAEDFTALVGGHPFHHFYSHSGIAEIREEQMQFQNTFADTGRRKILVTLQNGVDLDASLPGLWQTIMETQEQMDWLIRMHPQMLPHRKRIEQFLSQKGIQKYHMDLPSRANLITLLAKVDGHITSYSSSVIEAADWGLRSIVLHPIALDLFPFLHSQKMIQWVQGPEELKKALQGNHRKFDAGKGKGTISPQKALKHLIQDL